MNITSFTSLDPNGMGNSSSSSSNNNNNNNSNDKNFDSSSTAYLTLNAANNVGQASTSTTCGNNSDSDQDVSPSVTVLRSITGNNHSNHHSHHLPRPSRLLTGGFSFSNRIQLTTKHQRTIWSRATYFEKLLLLALLVLFTISLLLFMFLGSVIMKQRNELRMFANTEAMGRNVDQEVEIFGEINSTVVALSSNKTKKYCLTPDCVKVAASVIEAIDLTVDPCDDFYLYSCGDWIKSNPLPDGKSNWGTFSKLWQDNQAIMRAVLEENNDFKSGSAEEKAKIYYESCLDRNDTVELRGTKPMQDFIESAGGWNISGLFDVKTWDLQSSLQIYHNQYNRGGLFSWAVGADERNSTRNIIQLDQGGLGLPSRDYYLNKTDKNIVLDAYLIYMIKVAELMGGTNVEEEMKEILEFEKKLALITVPQDQRRDDERMYNKFTLREFSKSSPFLNWTKYFDDAFDYHSKTTISFSSEIRPRQNRTDLADRLGNQTEYSMTTNSNSSSEPGKSNKSDQQEALRSTISKHKITDDEHIVIYAPEYFHDLAKLINEYSATDKGKVVLANYMAWSVIQTLIATLPKNFRDASKVLRKALIGSEGIEVSWRYCVTDTNQVMGFALGSLFVRRVFHGKSKERAEEMIFAIRNAFKDNLSNLSWMDDSTRSLAREKADYINQMIGFPDFILSPEKLNGKYEGLELDENNYFENNIKVNVLSLRENMEKLNKPANKTEWEMTPPMVNAYYTPTKNQIVFPAGILQTPFYDLSYPNSLNYGAMGVVMGHELTHAFDDQGREYDKDGNLYQWWYNETLKNFEERVKCFVDQYSSYKIDDNNLNGKQTLGENIADNGGLKAAFRAYEKWSERNPEPHLPGLNLTGKQLFFVGFAQVWCSLSTPEALKLQVLNDPHAPAQFRVIGTLSNSHEFAREFNCPAGSNMNPEKKCVVW